MEVAQGAIQNGEGGLFKEPTYAYVIFKRLLLAKHPIQIKTIFFKSYTQNHNNHEKP